MKIAILNRPSRALEKCELTFMDRNTIHFDVALKQHADYATVIRDVGVQVEMLEVTQAAPDSVFVEDTAIILDELAIVTSMGSASRRVEIEAMSEVVAGFRETVKRISSPANIEGGDVLRVGKTLFVGESSRTNAAGISALDKFVRPYGYRVCPVKVRGCLHLKTGITALDDETFIYNSQWIDASPFAEAKLIDVAVDEPFGANVLRIDDQLILNAAYPRTADKIEALKFKTKRVNISEFGKAEAGLTCMSLVFEQAI